MLASYINVNRICLIYLALVTNLKAFHYVEKISFEPRYGTYRPTAGTLQ